MRGLKWKLPFFIGLMIIMFMGGEVSDKAVASVSATVYQKQPEIVKIGAILPLTGELSSKGEQIRVALTLSAREVNAYLADLQQPFRVEIAFRDSKGIPEDALLHAKALKEEGIPLLIAGSSAEVEHIKPWSDANDVLVVSYSSSAPSLGVPNDSVFRVVPDDRHQAHALATLLESQGIQVVIPVYRNDVYGREMADLFTAYLEDAAPAAEVAEAISYAPQTKDFADVVQRIEETVAASGAPRDRTAVLLIAFEEANGLFASADRLQDIRWYGTETLTLNSSLNDNPEALEFAEKVGFTGVSYGLLETSYYFKVKQAIETEIGRVAMPNAIYAYDIPWLLASLLSKLENPMDTKELKERFVELSEQFIGATGWVVLNDAGDRKYSDYDIWQIQLDGEAHYWERLGTYLRAPGFPGYINWETGYAPAGATGAAFWLGFNQSSYNPLSYVYRDEFAYMLMNAVQNGSQESVDEVKLSFADQGLIDIRARDSVKLAVKRGVLTGYADQTLRPHQPITRAEMATMVGRALGMSGSENLTVDLGFYSDAEQIPEWAKDSVVLLTNQGILGIAEGDRLGPSEYITLAEATAICFSL